MKFPWMRTLFSKPASKFTSTLNTTLSKHPRLRSVYQWTTASSVLISGVVILGAATAILPVLFPAENQFPQAANTLQLTHRFIDKPPRDTLGNFYFMLGTQMAARGQILVAEDLLKKATLIQPDNADGFLNYGVVLEALDRLDNALDAYQHAAKIQAASKDGVNAQTLYTMGLLQDKMGHTQEGITTLQHALQIEPKNNLIAYDLGVLYSKTEDYEKAATYSKLSVDGLQDFAEGYNNYAYALAHLARYDEALKAVNRSLDLKSESAAALDTRGFIYSGMKKYPDALAEYKKALTLDPTIGEIYLHMGEAYEQQDDYTNAIRAFEQYIQLTPRASDLTIVRDKISKLKQRDFAKKGPVTPNPALSGNTVPSVQPVPANTQ